MKTFSIKINDQLSRQFDQICQRTGYKKNTLLARLIASFVRHQKDLLEEKRDREKDPFDAVIGLMKVEPFLESENEIDKIVYHQ